MLVVTRLTHSTAARVFGSVCETLRESVRVCVCACTKRGCAWVLITVISGHCGSDCLHASQLTSSFFKEYITVLVPQTWISMNQLTSSVPLSHSLALRLPEWLLLLWCVYVCLCKPSISECVCEALCNSELMICPSDNRHSLLFYVCSVVFRQNAGSPRAEGKRFVSV